MSSISVGGIRYIDNFFKVVGLPYREVNRSAPLREVDCIVLIRLGDRGGSNRRLTGFRIIQVQCYGPVAYFIVGKITVINCLLRLKLGSLRVFCGYLNSRAVRALESSRYRDIISNCYRARGDRHIDGQAAGNNRGINRVFFIRSNKPGVSSGGCQFIESIDTGLGTNN